MVHSFTGTAKEVAELVRTIYRPALHLWPERFSRYKWDSTSGAFLTIYPALAADYMRSVNGCSMKTEANLAAVKAIPPGKIMFETGWSIPNPRRQSTLSLLTDSPWCSMTASHASKPHINTLPTSLRSLYFPPNTKPERFVHGKAVKGRNEPSAIGGVAWVLHRMNEGVPFERITERAWENTVEVFGLDELKDVSEGAPAPAAT